MKLILKVDYCGHECSGENFYCFETKSKEEFAIELMLSATEACDKSEHEFTFRGHKLETGDFFYYIHDPKNGLERHYRENPILTLTEFFKSKLPENI